MSTPEKPVPKKTVAGASGGEADIDALYGLEPVLEVESTAVDSSLAAEFSVVQCPYCGEAFETRIDGSAGSCTYVEDCQVCCQPIEMSLNVDSAGRVRELLARRGDS